MTSERDYKLLFRNVRGREKQLPRYQLEREWRRYAVGVL
jgi:hypothetical protein